jgi:hypothetical protein
MTRRFRRPIGAAVVVVAASTLVALSVPAHTATAANIQFFQTPSKDVGCAYQPADNGQVAYLRCDIVGGIKPLPPKPASCDVDWGLGYEMRRRGRAHVVCAGDTVRSNTATTLSYGQRWKSDGFTCVARRTGLRCTNAARHGFVLNTRRSRTF